MLKIGVVTLGGYHNYGNRLQNAALVHVLEKKIHVDALTVTNWGNSKEVYQIRGVRGIAGFIKKIGVNYFIQKKRMNNFPQLSS